jgi:hypothetical protein
MNNKRYRLTDDEYEIIAESRKQRIHERNVANGKKRGEQIKEAHQQETREVVKKRTSRTVFGTPPRQTDEQYKANGKRLSEKLAEKESRIKGIEMITQEIKRRGLVPSNDQLESSLIAGSVREDDVCEVTSSRVGIISDMHWPFHDLHQAANGEYYGSYISALEHLKEQGIGTLIINGDAMDCYQLSRHEKVEKNREFSWELDVARSMLSHLREYFGDRVRIIYREGNHEERFAKYVADKADALKGVVDLPTLLKLSSLHIEWVGEKRKLSIGKLWVDHGHEWFGSGGVNPARAYRMKANDNILLGHVHRTTFDMVKRPLDGSVFAGWTMGCLCDLNPYYAPRNMWNHGVCTVDLEKTGDFTLNNRIIINGKVR